MNHITAGIDSMRVEAMAIQAEVDGANAENKQREINGESMAYAKDYFDEQAEKLWGIANSILIAARNL